MLLEPHSVIELSLFLGLFNIFLDFDIIWCTILFM
jgi:hypothetical protein